jgi:hypothetical protein
MSKVVIRRPDAEENERIAAGIADDLDARELNGDFFAEAIHVGDFESPLAARAFLLKRHQLSSIAADLGMGREAWDALFPNDPGFEERFARMLEESAAKVRAVAAE